MKTLHLSIITLSLCLISLAALPPVHAQQSLTVSTDAALYGYGDRYIISGVVNPVIPNQWVLIQIAAPSNPSLASIPVKPTSDGTYSYTLHLGNENIPVGNFTITAIYAGTQNQTQFSYLGTKCNHGDTSSSSVPIIRRPSSNPDVLDSFGNLITGSVKVGQQIQVATHIDLGQSGCQRFAYLVQIQDSNGVTVSLSWLTGMLFSGQSLYPAQSWIPTYPGTYSAQTFLWQSLENPNSLAPPSSVAIEVTGSESIVCKQGFQLVIRNENGHPSCVLQESVSKLIERHWGVMPLAGLPTSH